MIPGILPHASGENCLTLLRECANQLMSVRGTSAMDTTTRYIEWATLWAERLSQSLFESEIDRLILTPRFYAILSNSGGSSPVSFPLVNTEIVVRQRALVSSVDDLRSAIDRWRTGECLIVMDTNVYLHSPALFPEMPLRDHCPHSREPHLIILMVNLDELDRQKRVGDATQKKNARATLREVEELIRFPDQAVRLSDPKDGATTVEVMLDPPGHVRLIRNDDEIVDRARAISDIAGKRVTLLTADVGMLIRARGAELDVRHIEWPEAQPVRGGRRQ